MPPSTTTEPSITAAASARSRKGCSIGVQLAWPDRSGRLPWEAGFDHRLLLAQPVVGARDEVSAAE